MLLPSVSETDSEGMFIVGSSPPIWTTPPGAAASLFTMMTPDAPAFCAFLTFTVKLQDRKSTRLNSSHANISYAVFCLKKITLTHTILLSHLTHPPIQQL